MNTLFKSKVSRKSAQPDPEERIPKTIEIKSISHGEPPLLPSFRSFLLQLLLLIKLFLCSDIEEKGVRMKLTVIDTPGFGDQINNENW